MVLQQYRRKRHFNRTPEPEAKAARSPSGRSYVIQKHAATRLHYDFRLELDGVLKSWAVPRGPSLDPAERRLAVHVEDHPVEYGSFEGIIPPGEYGGGTVMLWDRGTWEPIGDPREGYRRGRLKFRLDGQKLRGGWTLIRMAKEGERENWLLIKEKDEYARGPGQPDILQQKPDSVATGRSLEQIAAASDRVWTGDAEARPATPKPKPASRARQPGKASIPRTAGARPRTIGARRRSKLDPSTLNNARKVRQPGFIEPQLATLVKAVPPGSNWLHEIKFDGYRILAVARDGEVRLMTRHQQDWTARFPGIVEAVTALPLKQAVLDGELVVLRPDGVSDFQLMQNALKDGSRANLVYYLFDLPHCQGYDLTRTPLLERKEFLRGILADQPAGGPIRYSDHIRGEGIMVLQHACRLAMEGIICKRVDAPYESGRTNSWVKVKCIKRQEFVIGGYTDPSGSRIGLGALLLGYYEGQGRLRYAGKVGTGFNAQSIREVLKRLKPLKADRPPFYEPPRGAEARGAHWTRPELVAEVEFSEWTDDGHLRHPSFQGLREDKSPREVIREEPEPTPTHALPGRARQPAKSQSRAGGKEIVTPARLSIAGVTLTHPDRVIYPEQGLTKRDLADYYQRVASWMLPHITGRPLSLVRCPEGRAGECFYQKHVTEHLPPAIRGIPIREKGSVRKYFAIDDLAGLISLVQTGALEIHTWGSREEEIEHPDHLVFDLDPGPGVGWSEIVEAARLVREQLSRRGLESFVKTSGGKGLHVVAPLVPGPDWDEVKEFSKQVAAAIAGPDPRRYTAAMSKARRSGRIFIDYLRNGRGATAIAPYSTRARPGAPVSTPVRWDELSRIDGAAVYTVQNLPKRLAGRRKDPWAGYFTLRQSLP